MDFSEQAFHLLNFVAPAWGVALFVALAARGCARWGWLPRTSGAGFKPLLFSGCAGTGVLVAGLVVFGVDGKMSTYLALVVVCASVQWQMCRA